MLTPPELRCAAHGLVLAPMGAAVIERAAELRCAAGCTIPVVGGIPRFVPSDGYASGFGLQWKHFRRTQLDSYTGTTISRDRLARCLGGSLDVVRGRSVLEAGCGAGRFTEILLDAGARVFATDLSAAVEANFENCGRGHRDADRYFVCQADLRRLPVAPASFDVVICLGVVQHTPSPEETISRLASYVRPGGLLVLDHYSPAYPLTVSRRVIRSALLRLPAPRATSVALRLGRTLAPVHRLLWTRRRGFGRLRTYLSRVSPFVDYFDGYPQLPASLLTEWGVLDTHDALTDRYKHFRRPAEIAATLTRLGLQDVVATPGGNGVEARARVPLAARHDTIPVGAA